MLITARKTRRVLVVDDDQTSAVSLGMILTEAGYQVETAFNGNAALELLRRFEPEICILDINMPGMSGYELARHIREELPDHTPVLATMTACSTNDHLDRAVDAGFDLHFGKPADVNDLIEQLESCLNRWHSPPRLNKG